MKSVWKFPVAITDEQTIQLPRGSEPLTVQLQGGEPFLWARVDPSAEMAAFAVRLTGTGHPLEDDVGKYAGTFQMHGGDLVFHVFLRPVA
jgi:hypothetical protein